MSAGNLHSVLLLSTGEAVAFGSNICQQCNIPKLGAGERYIDVAAGGFHTLLLRSDGRPLAIGDNSAGQCNLPELGRGVKCISVAAGDFHSVLVLDVGEVVAFGRNNDGQCTVPQLPGGGVAYVRAAASARHTVLLRSDGVVVAFGNNSEGQCDVPQTPDGVKYVDVAAGDWHTALLRSDGTAKSFGRSFPVTSQCVADLPCVGPSASEAMKLPDSVRQSISKEAVAVRPPTLHGITGCCLVPLLEKGGKLTSVQAGSQHTVYLKNDGTCICVGSDIKGQCQVPDLPAGLVYVAATAGHQHTLLLRSDGQVVAFGDDSQEQCQVPLPAEGATFIAVASAAQVSEAEEVEPALSSPEATVAPDSAAGLSETPPLERNPVARSTEMPRGAENGAQATCAGVAPEEKRPDAQTVVNFGENEIAEYKDDTKDGSPRQGRCDSLLICCKSR